jgi:hypothetical protein
MGRQTDDVTPPDEPSRPDPVAARSLLDRARALARSGDRGEALRGIGAAVALAPDDPDIRLAAGRVAVGLEEWATAEEHAQAALALRPSDDAMALLGAALEHRSDVWPRQVEAGPVDDNTAEHGVSASGEPRGGAPLDVRMVSLVILGSLGVAWTFVALPEWSRLPLLLVLAIVAAALGWGWWSRHRADAADVHDLGVAEGPELSTTAVLGLRVVLGVACLIAVLYGLQLVAPPAEGATTSTGVGLVVVAVSVGVAGACAWALRRARS